jgi:hypothetical protein
MTANDLKLPEAFVALVDRPKPLVYWEPKGGPNAWMFKGGEGGLYWVPKGDADSDDILPGLILPRSLAQIEEETNKLPVRYHLDDYTPEEIAKGDAEDADLPGFIPFISDFSQIVVFGHNDMGEDYCFDYRENPDGPSIIHWNDSYWRRVAPNFDAFISLFEVPVLSRFTHRSWPATPETKGKPLPEGMDGRQCLRLDRPSVTRMRQWSREQPDDQPLNLLFATVKRGWLHLFAIDTKEEMQALDEDFEELHREMEAE